MLWQQGPPLSQTSLRGGKDPAVLAVVRSQLHAFRGLCFWITSVSTRKCSTTWRIAGRYKNIISSEVWCHDCHVMCNWNLFVRLSAASFTAAVSCCNASNSGCTAIKAIRAIRTKAMTDHRVAGSTDCRRCHLSWNSSCGVVGLALTPFHVLPKGSPVFVRFGLMPS